ncbi:oxidoreductase domain containing protein [Diplodia corticola]|uniref:Oxidoreductase domain containing protein n=1 Tax=Diplodia corticola TaxID=236234 RepID=A0A1J9RXR5_9PEZI|nr:oxidoreductase domain containing protein [Diplodia corticola]OJD37443.1 oxidoreductase domain containing protein [Diplodia corticola]
MPSPTIPSSFLRGPAPPTVSTSRIDFAFTPVPEYANCYATVIDDALTPSECATLLRLAAAASTSTSTSTSASSTTTAEAAAAGGGGIWERAMINTGGGRQAMAVDTRNCGRIIYDSEELAGRLWARVAPLVPELAVLEGERWAVPPNARMLDGGEEDGDVGYGSALHGRQVQRGERWRCAGLNERLRFLRYVGGEYFKPHCDGAYERGRGKEGEASRPVERSFFTLHLYLNDGEEVTGHAERERRSPFIGCVEGEPEAPLKGGATTFHSTENWFSLSFGDPDPKIIQKRVDVVPRVGRILLFQHRNMVHSGDDVLDGVKYTMRTDVMFTKEVKEDQEE